MAGLRVSEFLAGELARPFAWGETDCAHTADRWARHVSGRSALTARGIDFADEAGARGLMDRFALPVWVGRAMRAAGFAMTESPGEGDVGVVVSGPIAAVAIKGPSGWLWRDETGLHHAPDGVRVLGAWRIA